MYKEKWKLKRAVYTVHSHEVQTQQLNYAASQGSQTFFKTVLQLILNYNARMIS